MRSDLDLAAESLLTHRHVVCLTGAGMSVESGIRPFRGPGGVWTENGEPPLDDYRRFLDDPVGYWQKEMHPTGQLGELYAALHRAVPHKGHLALAGLERLGIVKFLITQNIDDLHRRAGSRQIAEIHGNYTLLRCVGCGKRFDRRGFDCGSLPPSCPECGDMVKGDVVVFGEPIPQDVATVCIDQIERADCLLLVGTSGYVYPAAGFPHHVKANGGTVIEIGPYETDLTEICDVSVRLTAAEALPIIERTVRGAGLTPITDAG